MERQVFLDNVLQPSLENSWKWRDLDVAALEAFLAESVLAVNTFHSQQWTWWRAMSQGGKVVILSCFQFHFETFRFNYFIGAEKGRFKCPAVETVAQVRSLFGLSVPQVCVHVRNHFWDKGLSLGGWRGCPSSPFARGIRNVNQKWANEQQHRTTEYKLQPVPELLRDDPDYKWATVALNVCLQVRLWVFW